MGRKQKSDNSIKRIVEGRAVRILVAAVSAFLCALTLLEFLALRMEWEIPALAVISGENGFWSEEYQREELAFDDSAENELLVESGTNASAGTSAESGANASAGMNAESGAGTTETSNVDTEQTDATGKQDAKSEAQAGAAGQSAEEKRTPDAEEAQEMDAAEAQTPDAGESQETDAPAEPELPYYIRINRQQNCITVYTLDEDGEYTVPYKAMICSTGLYNATPRGTYQISTKYLWRELYGGVYGQYATRIHGGILFHSVPYYSKSKSSLCTDKYNKLGQQASMGCVRLTVEDAKWIAENCPEGTTVEIYDDEDPGPLGKPDAVKIDTDSPNKGWDPTDPDEDNPWHEADEESRTKLRSMI